MGLSLIVDLNTSSLTEATSKSASTPKKKATVQAKLSPSGQITSPKKDPGAVPNPSPKKFSGFTGRSWYIDAGRSFYFSHSIHISGVSS